MKADLQQPQLRSDGAREDLGRANYFALRIGRIVKLFAFGANPSGGWTNYFELSPIQIYPPQFLFFSVPPGFGPDVITPFLVDTTVRGEDIDALTVWDADGAHRVQVVGLAALTERRGGDGPFPRQEHLAGWVSSG
ncbi:MAG TPA: hypothetical protein VGF48_22185 [Thermoanaerobaculia bacterium]|jgi:hypothetical protein